MPPVPVCRFRTLVVLAVCGLVYGTGGVSGQTRARTTSLSGVPAVPLPDEPVVLYSAEQPRIRVEPSRHHGCAPGITNTIRTS